MTQHRLDPLLNPETIALVGVSDKDGSPGYLLFDMVVNSSYRGQVFLVNPRRDSINGHACFDALAALPLTVDHVVLALGNQHLEAALNAVIAHGAKAVTIYSSGILADDFEPPLLTRLTQMAKAAKLAICGANGMGFYNVRDDLYAGIFPRAEHIPKGNISYIAQSGSAFTTLSHNGCRLGFNLCVSSGNEMTTTVADYMSWSLAQSETRVIGLFLEAVRDPQAFIDALEQAQGKKIPVVILKIGKSPLSAEMALTHTGAVAGSHAAFEALYRRYGVISVDGFDEMAAILMLLQHAPMANPGKLATVQESGGFRELVTDIAHELGVEFAAISDESKTKIQPNLDPGLKAENPLDAWGTHDNFETRFLACLMALMQDPDVAGGIFFSNFRDGYFLSEAIYRVVEETARKVNKPIVLGNCYSDLANTEMSQRAFENGIAIIDGTRETLLAFKHLFAYQQFKTSAMNQSDAVEFDKTIIIGWRSRLKNLDANALSEAEAMRLLADFGITVPKSTEISHRDGLVEAAKDIGYPLVLKTAKTSIHHKSDAGGVIVNIQSEQTLLENYDDLARRLGPKALLTQMVDSGVEIGLGVINDPQFGPLLMVAAGGILIEVIEDSAVALCPVSAEEAKAMIGRLKIKALLNGVRGQPAVSIKDLINTMVRLSKLAYALKDCIDEIDINPVIVSSESATAVDALIVKQDF